MKYRIILFSGVVIASCLTGVIITSAEQILDKIPFFQPNPLTFLNKTTTSDKESVSQKNKEPVSQKNAETDTSTEKHTSIHITHPSWNGNLEITGNKACRPNRDCGTIKFSNNDIVEIDWDKWGTESFEKSGETYSLISTDETIEKEYAKLEHTFEYPYIKVNPFNKTPISALMKFPTEEPAQITITIKGKENHPDISHTFDTWDKEHNIPVLGLYPNHKNIVELTARFKDGRTIKSSHTVKLGNAPNYTPWLVLNKKDNAFNFYASYHGKVHDEEGNIRYIFNASGWNHTYLFKDEVIVEHTNGINRYDILGKHKQTYKYPPNFYTYIHGMGQKPNGNFLVFGSFNKSMAKIEGTDQETHRDFILEIDYHSGQVLKKYDLAEMLNPDRSLVIKSSHRDYNKIDWAHTNGIDYDAENSSIIVSGRHMGIAKINEKTGKLTWWMTIHQQTNKSGRNGKKGDISHKLLTAVDNTDTPYPKDVQKGIQSVNGFKWPLKTHSIKYAGNGIYSIFDNSGNMYDQKLKTSSDSVASVFKIDDEKKTVQQIFLKHLNAYSEVGSSVVVNPNNPNDVWVTATQVGHSNNFSHTSTHIWRFNMQTGEEIYRATTPQQWHYLIHPYTFYKN